MLSGILSHGETRVVTPIVTIGTSPCQAKLVVIK